MSVEREMQALSQFDHTHSLIEELYWKAQMDERQKGVKDEVTLPNLQLIKDSLDILKSDYIPLIEDRDYAFELTRKTTSAFQGKERKVNELTLKLESTKDMLENIQLAVMEVEGQFVDFKLFRKQENAPRVEEIEEVIGELDSLQEEFDLENFTRKTKVTCVDSDQQDGSEQEQRDGFQVLDYPFFELGIEKSYDNPLFLMDDNTCGEVTEHETEYGFQCMDDVMSNHECATFCD